MGGELMILIRCYPVTMDERTLTLIKKITVQEKQC